MSLLIITPVVCKVSQDFRARIVDFEEMPTCQHHGSHFCGSSEGASPCVRTRHKAFKSHKTGTSFQIKLFRSRFVLVFNFRVGTRKAGTAKESEKERKVFKLKRLPGNNWGAHSDTFPINTWLALRAPFAPSGTNAPFRQKNPIKHCNNLILFRRNYYVA